MMDNDYSSSSDLNLTAETSRLVTSLLEKHRRNLTKDDDEKPETCGVKWVSVQDFNVDEGKRQIRQYIKTWGLAPCWLYSVVFLHTTAEHHHTFHHYRACFSTPTPQKPIQGTASVFFVMCIPDARPPSKPVEVGFMVESNRLVHTPGATRFTDRWLLDVIRSKSLLRDAVQF